MKNCKEQRRDWDPYGEIEDYLLQNISYDRQNREALGLRTH
jgi:hypothetical protein